MSCISIKTKTLAQIKVQNKNKSPSASPSAFIRVSENVDVPKARSYRPFPSSPGPLYQNEVKCSAFDMEMIFHSYANNTHFLKKGCALGLILKVRVLELRSGLLKTGVLKVRANRRSCFRGRATTGFLCYGCFMFSQM